MDKYEFSKKNKEYEFKIVTNTITGQLLYYFEDHHPTCCSWSYESGEKCPFKDFHNCKLYKTEIKKAKVFGWIPCKQCQEDNLELFGLYEL